jgi:hypothetical protein
VDLSLAALTLALTVDFDVALAVDFAVALDVAVVMLVILTSLSWQLVFLLLGR